MTPPGETATTYRFGPFRFGVAPYSLSRSGEAVDITPQQAQLLEVLLQRASEVVSREVIRERLWPEDVHVDFDRSINFCVARLRSALDDRSDAPTYIETVPRRGYRFVGSLSEPPSPERSEPPPSERPETEPSSRGSRRPRLLAALLILGAVSLIAIAGWFALRGHRTTPEAVSAGDKLPTPEGCEAFSLSADLPPEAADAFHRGSYFASRWTYEDRARAIEALDVVLLHRPDFEPALSCQARLYSERYDWDRAEPMARRAMELESRRVDAHLVLAEAAFRHQFDWRQAEARSRAGLKLYPRHRYLRTGYASLLSAMGKGDEATRLARETVELYPLSLSVQAELAEELYLAGDFEEAVDVAEQVVDVDSRFADAFMISIYSLLEMGRDSDALSQGNRLLESWGRGPAAVADLEGFWEQLLQIQSYGDQADQAQLSELAALTLAAGRTDEAVQLMERACAERSGWSLPYFDVDPRFRPFHAHTGLESLAACLRPPFDLGRAGRPRSSD